MKLARLSNVLGHLEPSEPPKLGRGDMIATRQQAFVMCKEGASDVLIKLSPSESAMVLKSSTPGGRGRRIKSTSPGRAIQRLSKS